MENLAVFSSAFKNNEKIPAKYTVDGERISPPLTIKNTPANTRSLALILKDPDAPMGTFIHWVVWNIPSKTREIAENYLPTEAVLGKNTIGKTSYIPPAPPSGTHRYIFELYALDIVLPLPVGSSLEQLEKTMAGHVISKAQLMGKYR